jgi:hypothetical protein
MNPSDAWEMVKRTVSTSPSVINALTVVKLEGVENDFLVLSGPSSSKPTVNQFQRPILEMMGKRGIEATDIDYIAPPPKFQVVQAAAIPMPSQESELDRLRRENAQLQSQVADLQSRLRFEKVLHAGKQPVPTVGGCNLAFLLPLLPNISNPQAKAILTLVAMGGAVTMPAIEFARKIGIKTQAVSYKRMFEGLDFIKIDGKNLAMVTSLGKNLATVASSDTPIESENLLGQQGTDTPTLLPQQEIDPNLATTARNDTPHDYDDDINKKSSSDVESSIMPAAAQTEVLRFAFERLNFNPQSPPAQLAQHDPLNAMALVLQAQHTPNVRSKAGLWKTMINQHQPADDRWLDLAGEMTAVYGIKQPDGTFQLAEAV